MALILVDMDCVLADFEEGHRRMCAEHGLPPVVEARDRVCWDILEAVPTVWRDTVKELWHAPGFFAGLDPIVGAVETLHTWSRQGHKVYICTAPLMNSETCAQEKLAWVRRHVGLEFVRRTIITADKTLVQGNFLLDDRPDITGDASPTWKHLLFATHANRFYGQPDERYTWTTARSLISQSSS